MHFQTFGAEKNCSHRISQKFDFASLEKKLMTFFLLFHYIFVYYPPFIQHFVVFNCRFSVASPLLIYVKKNFSHFQKCASTQVTYSFKIYIKNFFSSLQKIC